MKIEIEDGLANDITSFCSANSIEDVDSFVLSCFLKGYNIIKFGLSPMDNAKKEKEPVSIDNNEVLKQKGKKVKIVKKTL